MKTSRIITALFLLSLLAPASFAGTKDFNLNAIREVPADIRIPLPQEAQPVPSAAAVSAGEKEWTVIIFINGSNNLSEYFFQDVNTIANFGATKKLNVVLEF